MAADYAPIIQQAAQEWNLDPHLLQALIEQESGGDPTKVSKAGARGLTGLMPDTAKGVGVTDLTDPTQQIYGGAKYLSQALDAEKTPEDALRFYHGGPDWRNSYGPESAAYAPAITARYTKMAQAQQPAPSVAAPSDDPFTAALKGAQNASSAPGASGAEPAADPFTQALTEAQKSIPASVPPPPAPEESGQVDDYGRPIPIVPSAVPTAAPGSSLSALPRTIDEARADLNSGVAPGYVSMAPLPIQLKETAPGSGVADPNSGLAGLKADWLAPVRGIGNAALDLLEGTKTGVVTPAATSLLAGAAMGGGLTPSIARGTGQGIAETAAYGRPLVDQYAARPTERFQTAPSLQASAPTSPLVSTAAPELPPPNPLAATVNAPAFVPPGSRIPAAPLRNLDDVVNALKALPDAPARPSFVPPDLARPTAPIEPQPTIVPPAFTEGARSTPAAPQSVGAAASRDMTAPSLLAQPKTAEQAATDLRKSVLQTAEDRADPQGVDNTVYVPGVERPLAAREFSPQNSVAEKVQRETDPAYDAQYKSIEKNNNDTMMDLYLSHAGDANALARAEEARDAVTPGALKVFNNQQPVNAQPVVDTIDGILAGPAGKRSAVASALNDVRASLFDKDGNLETAPDQLYGARQNLTDRLNAKLPSEASSNAKTAKSQLGQVLDALDPVIAQGAPKFTSYLQQYSEASKPIDQMRFLQDQLSGPGKITDVNGRLQFNRVQKLLEQVDKAKASKNISPAKSLTEDQIQDMVAIRNELAAFSHRDSLARTKGSDTTQKLSQSPLGTAMKGAADLAVHGAVNAAAGPLGNALYQFGVKPAVEHARAARSTKATNALKARLLETQPNPLSSP